MPRRTRVKPCGLKPFGFKLKPCRFKPFGPSLSKPTHPPFGLSLSKPTHPPFGLSLSKPGAPLRQAQRERGGGIEREREVSARKGCLCVLTEFFTANGLSLSKPAHPPFGLSLSKPAHPPFGLSLSKPAYPPFGLSLSKPGAPLRQAQPERLVSAQPGQEPATHRERVPPAPRCRCDGRRRHRPSPAQPSPDRTGPDRTGPDRIGPDRIGPDRTGSDRIGQHTSPAAASRCFCRTGFPPDRPPVRRCGCGCRRRG